jgi:hypothetical protein
MNVSIITIAATTRVLKKSHDHIYRVGGFPVNANAPVTKTAYILPTNVDNAESTGTYAPRCYVVETTGPITFCCCSSGDSRNTDQASGVIRQRRHGHSPVTKVRSYRLPTGWATCTDRHLRREKVVTTTRFVQRVHHGADHTGRIPSRGTRRPVPRR